MHFEILTCKYSADCHILIFLGNLYQQVIMSAFRVEGEILPELASSISSGHLPS